MKVLFLIQRPQARGQEIFAAQLGKELRKRGLDLKLLSLYSGSFELPFTEKIESLNLKSARSVWNPLSLKRLERVIRNFDPEIIQANGGDTLKILALAASFYSLKAKLIFNNGGVMGYYINTGLQHMINRYFLRRMDGLVSVSKFSQRDLDRIVEAKLPHQVIPIAVKTSELTLSSKDDLAWLNIAGFTPEKNHLGLLRIFQEGLKAGLTGRLVLIGDGPLKEKAMKFVQNSEMENRVAFVKPTRNPWNDLAKKPVLILPSLIEGMPAVIAEALSLGIPVIAYRVGGVAEMQKEFPSIKAVAPGDDRGFLKVMLDMQENWEMYSAEARQLRAKAKDYYGMSRTVTDLMDFYHSVCG